jgi:isocitrate dehydrogenase
LSVSYTSQNFVAEVLNGWLVYNGVAVPADGKKISYADGSIASLITRSSLSSEGTVRAATFGSLPPCVQRCRQKKPTKAPVAWYEYFAGEKAKAKFDTWLPGDTVEAVRNFVLPSKAH